MLVASACNEPVWPKTCHSCALFRTAMRRGRLWRWLRKCSQRRLPWYATPGRTAVAVTGSDVVRCRKLVARDASVLALHRILASRRRDWRLAPPTGIMMRALCEVRQSGATPRWDLPANPGLGVFATANIPVGTLLFWRLHEARLLPGSGVSPLLQSYAMVHSMRPFVLLCVSRQV